MFNLKALNAPTRPRELYVRKSIAKGYIRHIAIYWPATGKGEQLSIYPTAVYKLEGTNLTITASDGKINRYKNILVLKSIATPENYMKDYRYYR